MLKYMWIKGKRYYLYDTYKTWEQALKVAKNKRKKNKCRYFIKIIESNDFLFPDTRYELYLNKCMKLW